jgi:hypothetical protein
MFPSSLAIGNNERASERSDLVRRPLMLRNLCALALHLPRYRRSPLAVDRQVVEIHDCRVVPTRPPSATIAPSLRRDVELAVRIVGDDEALPASGRIIEPTDPGSRLFPATYSRTSRPCGTPTRVFTIKGQETSPSLVSGCPRLRTAAWRRTDRRWAFVRRRPPT